MKKFVIFRASVIAGIVFLLSCGDRDILDVDGGGVLTQFNLIVTSEGWTVNLTWESVVDEDLSRYNVYRSVNEGEFSLYDSLSKSVTSFTDSKVTADVIYEYYVTALFDGSRESDPSETVRIIPGRRALMVTSEGLTVNLMWESIVDEDLSRYNVYRSVNAGQFSLYDSVSKSITSFTDLEVTADVIYEYYVTVLFDGGRESDPSEEEQIIPGPTVTWVFDASSAQLVKMTHDVAHRTGDVFNNLFSVAAFDIDENTGDIYLLDRVERSLILLKEGKDPLVLTGGDGSIRRFDTPTDISYDSFRDEFWITGGSAGSIYHFVKHDSISYSFADSFNTGGDAAEGQLDAEGDFWVVNNKQNSIVIYSRESGFQRITVGGFSGNDIMLALDEIRGLAYAANRSNGEFYRITAFGVKTPLPSLNGVILGAVEPSAGDLWLILDDNGNGSYDLAKLSEEGSRIITLEDRYTEPTWIGVNPFNSNVVVMDAAFSGASIEVFTGTGERLSSFGSFNQPLMGRILFER